MTGPYTLGQSLDRAIDASQDSRARHMRITRHRQKSGGSEAVDPSVSGGKSRER